MGWDQSNSTQTDGALTRADDDSSITGIRVTKPANSNRGTRITDDWSPTQTETPHSWHEVARKRGFTTEQVFTLLEGFRDYWRGVPGQRGVKCDWEATWRNRLRDVRPPETGGYQARKQGNGVHQQPAAAGEEGWKPRGLAGAK